MKIEKITSINGFVLVVYYIPAQCFQFAVITPKCKCYEPNDIFYAAQAAEEEGRLWVATLSR